MTDTHDGSHTWLKYIGRKNRQAEEAIKEFREGNEDEL